MLYMTYILINMVACIYEYIKKIDLDTLNVWIVWYEWIISQAI